MSKIFKVKINEEISNYISLLNYNVNSRKDLTMEAANRFGVNSKVAKLYEQEFFIYDAKFILAKDNITNNLIPVALRPFTEWSLDYATSMVTITVNDSSSEAKLALSKFNLVDLSSELIIDKDINNELDTIYTAEFDDETGLKNYE